MTDIAPAPDAVLWDLDGTILDSRELHWLSWREVLAAEGVTVSRSQLDTVLGLRNDAVLRAWLGPAAAEADRLRIADAKEVCYRRLVHTRGIELLPGVETWLGRLAAAGWRQALATSAPRTNVETILEVTGIGPYFAAIVTADDVTRGKPEPDVFLTAAQRLGALIHRCVVVEDAQAGVEAARRAGMRCIGVGPAHASLPADVRVPSLALLAEDAFERVLQIA